MSRGGPPCRLLALWLSENCRGWRYGSQEYGIDLARNQSLVAFLRHDVPKGKVDLVMIDDDMVPVDTTEQIFHAPGELIYCGYVGRRGSPGHHGPGNFGAGCFRVSAKLLQQMPRPWFETTYAGGRRKHCECEYFHKMAQAAGVTAREVGVVGHEQKCVLLPSEDALGWSLAWEEDLAPRDFECSATSK